MDRVKESMFAMLEPLVDTVVVDLFAGTGALGLEALSRGAAEVYFVELKRRNVRIIEKNLARVESALPAAVKTRVFEASVLRAPQLLPTLQPDLIFADPPFHPDQDGNGVGGRELLADKAFRAWAGEALVIMEQPVTEPLPADIRADWEFIRERNYGDIMLYIVRHAG
jgi:16S rRNA (guanine966-N2)-methyltransferase